jgi:hypothetical protein
MLQNVSSLLDQINYMMDMTGFHEFAEFTAEVIFEIFNTQLLWYDCHVAQA